MSILELVQKIQTERPGWRFSLLGGSFQFDYKRSKTGKIIGVDKKKPLVEFGWKVEFFGNIDPSKCTGQRIVSTDFYSDPYDAIAVGCAKARKAIKEGVE